MKKLGVFFSLGYLLFGLSIDESVQKALEKSHKIKEQRHILSTLKAQLGIYEGAYYPKIDLSVGGDVVAGRQNYTQANIQLGITLNLFNGLKDSSFVEYKRYELLSLQSKIQAYKKQILSELQKAVGDFNLAKDQYLLSKKTIQSAKENYRIVSNRYKQNLENASALLDAELMLKTARANLLQAQYGIWESLFYVEYLVGREVGGFLLQ